MLNIAMRKGITTTHLELIILCHTLISSLRQTLPRNLAPNGQVASLRSRKRSRVSREPVKYQARRYLQPPRPEMPEFKDSLESAPLVGVMFASTMLSGLFATKALAGLTALPIVAVCAV